MRHVDEVNWFEKAASIGWLVLALLLPSCSGKISRTYESSTEPLDLQLRARLEVELKRLGKDISKATSQAPAGSDNAVFDLTAILVDVNGDPVLDGGTAAEVRLSWTERLIGDYDQNGEVNIGDLTPLGQFTGRSVTYDDPGQHNGFARWPSGSPDDPPSGGPPPVNNWRLARVDGDGNTEINIADITPIAAHWQEALSGYRVYRKGPNGEPELLPNPQDSGSALSAFRPSAELGTVTRFTYLDEPPVAGSYEYYVVGCLVKELASAAEAEKVSNSAVVDFQGNFSDTTPPTWDGEAGITSAQANADGTITVEFGTANDLPAPPEPDTPPVKYTLYYSTESPLDFGSSSKVVLDASPWTSPPLLAGQSYSFAVRAIDSAEPPNEEGNTKQLDATALGESIVDSDPPVWTETNILGNPVRSIRSVEPKDGELLITCADAADALSPPVHYDLYYISARGSLGHETPEDNFDPEFVPQGTQVIKDIPKVYSFPWENRHAVWLRVRAYDSADPPNSIPIGNVGTEFSPTIYDWVTAAPGNMLRIPVDYHAPGTDKSLFEVDHDRADALADTQRNALYSVYPSKSIGQDDWDIWFLDISADDGHWEAQQITTVTNHPSSPILDMALSSSGEVWLQVRVTGLNFGDPDSHSMYRWEPGGVWRPWEVELPPYGWNHQFAHNGLPAFFSAVDSEVQTGRFRLEYHWYDETAKHWVAETVNDPGDFEGFTFLRPDGVLQVLSPSDGKNWDDDSPTYGRILERQPTGQWNEVLSGVGSFYTHWDRNPLPIDWSSDCAWGASCDIRGSDETLIYGKDGYKFIPETPLFYKLWPAAGGGYHCLPAWLWDGVAYKECMWSIRNYLAAPVNTYENLGVYLEVWGGVFNPNQGNYASIVSDCNLDTGLWEVSLLKSAPDESIFIP